MNFFKRATTSITRKLGKTAILLALVFILGNIIAGSFSIEQSVKNTEAAVLKGIVPIATLQENWEKTNKEVEDKMLEMGLEEPNYNDPDFDYDSFDWEAHWRKREEIRQDIMKDIAMTAERIEELGELPSVDFYDYSNTAGLNSKEIRKYHTPESENSNTYYIPAEDEDEWFSIRGGMDGEILDIKMGIIEIVDGRTLDDNATDNSNEVLISKDFADKNNLQVGSTFILKQDIYIYPTDGNGKGIIARGGVVEVDRVVSSSMEIEEEYQEPEIGNTLEFEFSVVGLYEPNIQPASPDADEWNRVYMEVERRNMIYATNDTVKTINDYVFSEQKHYNPEQFKDQDKPYEYLTPIFGFRDNNDLEEFIVAVEGMFGEYYWVIDNDLDFDNIVAPLRNMSTLANIILYVGIGASLIILSLLITLFLRDRRNEIGIYLALGERKGRVIAQILAEVMLVSILGITISLFSGNFISATLTNSMIDNQVKAQQTQENSRRNAPPSYGFENNQLKQMGYGADVSLEDMAENYKVTLGTNIIIIFYAGGIITVLLSTLIPILYILRLNPRKILM
ncbi:MAG: ABC transporter permease [Oscillospiraceae bacterium]|nr:ABC transporter permease [Oscillospiraceae bacterium]